MIKFSLKLAAFLVLLLSSAAHAGLITDLTEDDYITIDELDWAWASTVNVENDSITGNVLSGPGGDFGWRYATIPELNDFKSDLPKALALLEYYINGELAYKNALSYWNSHISVLVTTSGGFRINSDIDDFTSGKINSELSPDISAEVDYLTFYVRNTPAQVPEPSTIMIFAIALIALSMRKRTAK